MSALVSRAPRLASLRRLARNKAILVGLVILGLVVLAALFAPLIAPYAPNKLSIVNKLKPPSGPHLFGTD